jgi:hypothetical protein
MINNGLRQAPKTIEKVFTVSAAVRYTKDGVIKKQGKARKALR